MTMREKMARAIWAVEHPYTLWDRAAQWMKDRYFAMADAAVAALEELFATATECADDLAAHLDAEHSYRDQYPTIQHDYDRDMDVVVRLRAMIGAAKGEG